MATLKNGFQDRLSLIVVVFNVSPTTKVIWRQGHGLKSHPTDW